MVKDYGSFQLYLQLNVKVFVYVISVNEYILEFNQFVFIVFVVENVLVGQFVIWIFVIDEDKGLDGEMIFFLVGGSNNKGFSLDSFIGVLIVFGRLDSE